MTRKEEIYNAATEIYGLDVRSVNNCVKAFSDGAVIMTSAELLD